MENDSVRTIGDNTLVDMWLSGKLRSVAVSREAIAGFLGLPPGQAELMSDDDRSEFVSTHLTLVAAAAASRLKDNPAADTVMIETAQLHRVDDGRGGDRRQGDRRKGDRRKVNLGPPAGERRRS